VTRFTFVSRFRLPKMFWIGLALVVFGSGPLLAIGAAARLGLTSDPNPNPIGPGLLAMLTFWPGIILTAIGAVIALRRRS